MSVFLNSVLSWYFKKRIQQVEYATQNPHQVQYDIFRQLSYEGAKTEFGRKYGFKDIKDPDVFSKQVPIQDYESLKPYIERMMRGEQQLLWSSEIKWFAKSSGTTSDKSKFIPVSFEALDECQFKGARDLLTIYCHNNPETKIFDGKGLFIGGSHESNQFVRGSYYGDLSAVMMNNLPFWVQLLRTPAPNIALMADWEEKLDMMVASTASEDVTNMCGVPTWTILLIKRIIQEKGLDTILDVWPNLELYMHGGVSFDPYRDQFNDLIPTDQMNYLESYNASEGFFGIQDSLVSNGDMLLMMDYGIYYEFLPLDQLGEENPVAIQLHEVEKDVAYALIITTNAGLWRYMIGDTIEFTDLNPYRIRIVGRTKLFINAFGEELMIDNAEKAITRACEATEAVIRDYTAAPVYFDRDRGGAHEWFIEFDKEPSDIQTFGDILDSNLKQLNSDYEAKRNGDLALGPPVIKSCKDGTFYDWLKIKGKLGAQHKVPRLSNDRKIIEELIALQ